ncbi:MAG: hypothetical protein ACQEQF_11020 [Bacillota bacterium]
MKKVITFMILFIILFSSFAFADSYTIKENGYQVEVAKQAAIGSKFIDSHGEYFHKSKKDIYISMTDVYYLGFNEKEINFLVVVDMMYNTSNITGDSFGWKYEFSVPRDQKTFELALTQLGGNDVIQLPKIILNIANIDNQLRLNLNKPELITE